jgi:hypothetical protein
LLLKTIAWPNGFGRRKTVATLQKNAVVCPQPPRRHQPTPPRQGHAADVLDECTRTPRAWSHENEPLEQPLQTPAIFLPQNACDFFAAVALPLCVAAAALREPEYVPGECTTDQERITRCHAADPSSRRRCVHGHSSGDALQPSTSPLSRLDCQVLLF